MGDTNIHYDSKTNYETIVFKVLLYSFGLQQLVKCPTHISGYCIDHIIIKNSSKLEISEPTTVWEISDYWITTCVVSITKPKIIRKECRYRKIKDLYTNEVGEDIQTMTEASKEIADENLPIFYNTELNNHGKTCPRIVENNNLKTRAEMDVRRFKEHVEECKIIRKKI